jgi:hypothetical protein
MKIVNVYKEQNGDKGHAYEVQFEAELYHSEINPKISFFKNPETNEICLNFKNWDTQEAIDSLNGDQAEEVLFTLVEAINFARHYDYESEPSLFDEVKEIDVKPAEQQG